MKPNKIKTLLSPKSRNRHWPKALHPMADGWTQGFRKSIFKYCMPSVWKSRAFKKGFTATYEA